MRTASLLGLLMSVAAGFWVSGGCAAPTASKAEIYLVWPFDAQEAAHSQDETAKALGIPKEPVLDLGNEVTMKLALIPADKFPMGSPFNEKDRTNDVETRHEVIISKPFYMGVYEVTQAQYEQVMGTNPSHFKGPTKPVEMVSWDDATEFCKKLSAKTGKRVTLPTEAQWEYACRAGTTTPFNTGDELRPGQANISTGSSFSPATTPVGRFPPNAFGLYDMHGNVKQWCFDWYDEGYYANSPKTDPQGPDSGSGRVLRGGCWYYSRAHCRSAYRSGGSPVYRNDGVGFRVAVDCK